MATAGVTVPGPTGVVTVSHGSGDVMGLAQQISAMLGAAWSANPTTLDVVTVNGSAPTTNPVTELLLTGNVTSANVPPSSPSWSAVVAADTLDSASTVVASNTAILVNDYGGEFIVSGNSTVAATGGNLLVGATGNYVISSASGFDTVFAAGVGTVGLGGGLNIIDVTGTSNLVQSTGDNDTIVAGGGAVGGSTTVTATGDGVEILGDSQSGAELTASVTGGSVTIGACADGQNVTLGGAAALDFAGSGTSNLVVTDAGTNATLVGGTGDENATLGGTGALYAAGSGKNNLTVTADSVVAFGSDVSGASLVAFVTGNKATLAGGAGTTSATLQGTDAVAFAGSGITNLVVSGDNATVVGGFENSAGTTYATLSGANAVDFASTGINDLSVSGANATLVGSTQAETVSTSSNTVLFGGSGAITFLSGAGTATLVGGDNGSEVVTVGAGGLVFSSRLDTTSGYTNTATIQSGAGVATILGADGGAVVYTGSQAGANFSAGSGNETLNASQSSTNNTFFAGAASATMSGGSGANIFAFFNGNTSGGSDVITDFSSKDSLYLIGYDSTLSAADVLKSAQVTKAGLTLTLSDNTTITFSNLTDKNALSGHILYT